jgi:mannosyltransferase OCH1-like enzyme
MFTIKNINKNINIDLSKYKRSFILKEKYDSVVPLNIYQTWYSKNLPPNMFKNTIKMKLMNPQFNYFLFDDNDCRNFIQENFDNEVLWAFDKLIPGAYKADLWRYCILYKNGGIYLDIKFKCINGFRLIALTEKKHFVNDLNENGIYNALIACKSENEILLKCINQIVQNVKNNYYGESMLHPTGPMLFENIMISEFKKELKKSIELKLETLTLNKIHQHLINYNNIFIMAIYDGYREEQNLYKNKEHYSVLWNNKNIYNI